MYTDVNMYTHICVRHLQLVNMYPNMYDAIDSKKSATAATVALTTDVGTNICVL